MERTSALAAPQPLLSDDRSRPLQFHDITFRVRDVNGWPLSLSSEPRRHGAHGNSLCLKLLANADCVERLYPKAKVIKISPFSARRSTTRTPQLAIDWHEINQRSAGPQLDQAY